MHVQHIKPMSSSVFKPTGLASYWIIWVSQLDTNGNLRLGKWWSKNWILWGIMGYPIVGQTQMFHRSLASSMLKKQRMSMTQLSEKFADFMDHHETMRIISVDFPNWWINQNLQQIQLEGLHIQTSWPVTNPSPSLTACRNRTLWKGQVRKTMRNSMQLLQSAEICWSFIYSSSVMLGLAVPSCSNSWFLQPQLSICWDPINLSRCLWLKFQLFTGPLNMAAGESLGRRWHGRQVHHVNCSRMSL